MAFTVVQTARPADLLAPRVLALAREAIAARGRFSLALSGGSLATLCFPALAELEIDWSKVHFFWADERAVPPTDPESNYGVAERLWLSRVQGPVVHRMEGEATDLEAAARRAEAEILDNGPLDLVLLGVGPDGHVASLFPGHPLSRERDRRVVAVFDAPKPPPRRLTLTLPALLEARALIIVATGAAKAGILREAVEDPSCELPIATVLREAADATLIVDAAAWRPT